MSFKSEGGADGEQLLGIPVIKVEHSLSPAPSSNTQITTVDSSDKRHHVAIDQPYSVFTHKEKWLIVILSSCAAIFRRVRCIATNVFYFADVRPPNSHISPFTANIYFPAIPVISAAFHKSVELINLTVTMYMVMQGLCKPFPFLIIRCIFTSIPRLWFSSDGLGNTIRSLRTQTNYVRLSSNSFIVLCRTCTSPDIRLLVVDALTMHPGRRICKHRCPW